MNIDVVDKSNWNAFQKQFSFKVEVPTLWSNAFDYSYFWINFV